MTDNQEIATTEQRLVFIVEDDTAVRASMRALLEASGYTVRDYASAEQFLGVGNDGDAGCIVLDYHLPGMSGIELIESLRARGDRTPAIIVTANGKQLIARASRAGVVAVLRKPMAADALTQWLDQIFGGPRRP